MTNGLITSKLHHKCYTKLYRQQKTSENDIDQEQKMNVDVTTVNTYSQNEPNYYSLTALSVIDSSTSDISNETSASMIIYSTNLNNLVNNDSIELPYYRLVGYHLTQIVVP